MSEFEPGMSANNIQGPQGTSGPASSPESAPAGPNGKATGTFNGKLSGLLDIEGGDKILKGMMDGIALGICKEMKKHEEKLKALNREHKRREQGKS